MDDYRNNYTNPYDGARNGLAIASIAFGIAGMIGAYLTGIFGIILGVMAVVFGAFSKGGAKRVPTKGVVGIAIGAAAVAFGLFMIGMAVYIMQVNPGGIMDSINEMMQGLTEFYSK